MTDIRDRIDPATRRGLEAYLAVVGPNGLSGITDLAERRARFAELSATAASPDALAGVVTEDVHLQVAGRPPESPLFVRLYRRDDLAARAPAVLYLHGGGLLIGSVPGDDAQCASLTRELGCIVASVEYRLAPEHPYPAALDDCYAALGWLAGQAQELGVDAGRLAVYGASAGGNLAAAVTLLARDRMGPAIAFQMLIYPMLDDRGVTESSHNNTGYGAWGREANVEAWHAVLGDATDVDAYAAPARAQDLAGLPPAYVDVGGLDLFRDEDVDYAHRLMQAGVDVELHVYPGGVHNGENWAPDADLSRRVVGWRTAALRRGLQIDS